MISRRTGHLRRQCLELPSGIHGFIFREKPVVDKTGKENVIMGVKEFFGKSIRSTDDDMDADQRLLKNVR